MAQSVKAIRLRAASSVVGLGTLISRLLGLVREVVLAAAFGASGAMDAFFVAFRIPNTLRRLLAEGGVTVAVQPVYTDVLEAAGDGSGDGAGERERARAAELAEFEAALFGLGRAVLVAVTAVGVVAAPALIPLFAAGFDFGGPLYDDAVLLLRLVFPFTYFIGLVGIGMGILNARGYFFAPAVGPAVLNLGVIAGALALPPVLASLLPGLPPTAAIAAGAVVGVAGYWWLERRDLKRAGVVLRGAWNPRHPGVRRVLALLVPAVAGLAVYQLQVVVGTQFASFLDRGGVSCLSYADRLVQFPLAMVGTGIGIVSLPVFSRERSAGRALNGPLGDALGWTLFLALPAAVGLVLLREPVVELLFRRGAFDAAAAERTALAVLGYGAALVPAAMNRIFLPAFYADKDMRTPVLSGLAALSVQAVLSLLWFEYDVLGLAGATAGGSAVQATVLLVLLARRGHAPTGWVGSVLRSIAACAAMGAVVYAVVFGPVAGRSAWLVVPAGIGAGVASYALAAALLGHPEWARLRDRLRRGNRP